MTNPSGRECVTLIFLNRSCSFDGSRNAVRFSVYDGMFEVRFLIETNALRTVSQGARSEDECLRAFDIAGEAILDAATHAYGRGGKDRHTLTAQDIHR